MKKTTGLLIYILLLHYSASAQSFAINTDGTAAHASAILDVKSINKGLLIPRMTKTERNSIVTPATGLMIFQTGPDSIGFHYYSGSAWSWVSSSSNGGDWKLTGNSGTNPATNFIGTLDNQPLRFRVNNVWAGEINQLTGNMSFGWNSLPNNSMNNNVAIGAESMRYNNFGFWNTAVGNFSLNINTTGIANTALGYRTMLYNVNGNYNTATGTEAMAQNVSGRNNTATGAFALQLNTLGSWNTAYGFASLAENRTGNNNTAIGNVALKTNKYGSRNTAVGDSADVLDSSYTNATAIGSRAAVNCSNCLVLGSVNGTNSAVSNVNVGIGTTTPQASLHVKRGAVLFDSTMGSTPVSGAGTRMMWIPAKAAFRGGRVDGNYWDEGSIGWGSFAFGHNSKASDSLTTAFGDGALASGPVATAMGFYTIASGEVSTAMGSTTSASGGGSTAMGIVTTASGGVSTATGYYTTSKSYGGFVTGLFNDTTNAASPTAIHPLNRIFQIGNGTDGSTRRNAVTVLQNGNVGVGTTTPQSILHVKRGAVLFDSTIGSTPVSGAGTRMMWIPAKAAFRGGLVDGNHWDEDSIGLSSFAFGYNSKATGSYSVSMGVGTKAYGNVSTAFGSQALASGTFSTALGAGTIASGEISTAIGFQTTASGWKSFAAGDASVSSGWNSIAMGVESNASGDGSFVSGYQNAARTYCSFVVGLYNDNTLIGSMSNINPMNRLFQVGNGTAGNARSNALTVLQNGNIGIGELIPTSPLNFASTLGDKIALWGNGANHYGLGIQASLMQVYTMDAGNDIAFGYGNSAAFTENVRIKGNGNVGIGTVNPVVPLNFSTNLGDKIAFWSNGTNHYGIGLQPSLLQLYTEASSSDIAFGYGNSASFTENLRIKGNGNVGIGTNAPAELLDVNGTTTTNGLQVSNGTVITKMQSGSVTVGANGTGQLAYVINFPVAFATAFPRVFATARNAPATNFGDAFSVSVRSVSANSVTLNIQRTDTNAGWGQLLRIDWFAVE